jgi:nucleotide-binding universal stress UspA family protein
MMQGMLSILIAYDGSVCAEAALDDLQRAGLPTALEAVVVTVADVLLPPSGAKVDVDEVPARALEVVWHARARAEQAVKEARAVAERVAKRVKADFPGWIVRGEACGDAPAWAISKMADRYQTDLIIVGARRHSVMGGRLILGSVSQRVLYEARCSVRVARCADVWRCGPVRIVVGFTNSPDAAVAVDAVASRAWPAGSEVRLVTALGTGMPAPDAVPADKLRAAGLNTSTIIRQGKPGRVLLDEVAQWGADALFVGTRDIHGMQHLLHGSVSSAVAAHAACSVEVARPRRRPATAKGRRGCRWDA